MRHIFSAVRAASLAALVVSLAFLAPASDAAQLDAGDELAGSRYASQFFIVDPTTDAIVLDRPPVGDLEMAAFRNTQPVLIKSQRVLSTALRSLDLSQWATIPTGEDATNWVRDRLVIDYPGNGTTLRIALVDDSAPREAMVQIIDAISKAYREEVLFEERIQRQKPRDILLQSYRNLADELKRKSAELQDTMNKNRTATASAVQIRSELMRQQIMLLSQEKLAIERERLSQRIQNAVAQQRGDDKVAAIVDKHYEEYVSQLDEKIEKLSQTIEVSAVQNPEVAGRLHEIAILQQVQDELAVKIEHWDIELRMPDHTTPYGRVEFHEGRTASSPREL